jgi:hypothetical protein
MVAEARTPGHAFRTASATRMRILPLHGLVAGLALVAGTLVVEPVDGEPLPPVTFTRHDITSQNPGQLSEGFTVGDVDGDGKPDMVEGGQNALLWYRNPDWTAATIATGFRYSAGAAIEVEDVDGDGRADVVTGRYPLDAPSEREMVWFANTPSGWVEHRMTGAPAFCHDMAFGDLDGDGRADVMCVDQFLDQISWLAQPADPDAGWVVHVIDRGHRPMGAELVDLDGDGRLDAVSGRSWFRNDGAEPWTRFLVTSRTNPLDPRFDDQTEVDVVDVDGDGRLDIVATLFGDSLQGELWVFFAPADRTSVPWPGAQLDAGPLWGIHSQGVGSFDGSPAVQIMVGEPGAAGFGFGTNPSPEIYVYRPHGPPRDAASWERTLVDAVGTLEAEPVDVDRDGRLDLAGHSGALDGSTPGRISWWENTTPGAAVGTTSTTTTTTLPATGCTTAACDCRRTAMVACVLEPVATGVRRRLARACSLLDAGAVRRASRLLRAAAHGVDRSTRRGRAAPACRGAIRSVREALGEGAAGRRRRG